MVKRSAVWMGRDVKEKARKLRVFIPVARSRVVSYSSRESDVFESRWSHASLGG